MPFPERLRTPPKISSLNSCRVGYSGCGIGFILFKIGPTCLLRGDHRLRLLPNASAGFNLWPAKLETTMPARKISAAFIEPMLLVRSDTVPEGPNWVYELKLDGYRALAVKSYGGAHLRSRNDKSFDGKYPAIVQALARLPDDTAIDGEVVVLDADCGRRATPL